MQKIIFPQYSELRHEKLLNFFLADIATIAGRKYYAALLTGSLADREVNIDAKVREKFEMPFIAFSRKLDDLWHYGPELSDGDIVNETIRRITLHGNAAKQIGVCRALVTCGLRAGPSCFPEIYQDRIHEVGSYEGKLEENLDKLSARAFISPHEVDATRNIQLLVTETEADLSQLWNGHQSNVIGPADKFSQAKHLSQREKVRRWGRKLTSVSLSKSYAKPSPPSHRYRSAANRQWFHLQP